MTRTRLIVLSAVVLSVLGWLVLKKDFGGTTALDPRDLGSGPGVSVEPRAQNVELLGVDVHRAGESEGQRVGVGEPDSSAAASSPPGHAVSGVVIAADGGALGADVRVRARWSFPRALLRGDDNLAQAPVEARVDVDRGGRFTVPVPPMARAVRLDVLSDFFSLEVPFRIRGDRTVPVQLLVTRGGCLLVEWGGPAAGDPEAVLSKDFELVAKSTQALPATQSGPGAGTAVPISRTAFVGEDGKVRFGGLPAKAPWQLTLYASSFVDVTQDVPAVPPMSYGSTQLSISRGIAAGGRVMDSAGEPVPGAALRLTTWEKIGQRYMLAREVTGKSGETGEFSLAGVLPGGASIHWDAEGYLPGTMALGPLADGESRAGLEVVLSGGGSITGLVSWPDGEAAGGAAVVVMEAGRPWREAARVTAAADGKFEATGLNGAAFTIDVTARRTRRGAQWRASALCQTGEHVGLTLGRGEVITGRVLDHDGDPVKKFTLSAFPVGRASDVVRVRVSGKDGAYELAGLGQGDWEISATARGYGREPSQVLSIPNGGAPVDLMLPGLCSLAGIVTDRGGSPVAGASLTIGNRRTVTDEEGAFELEKLEPGEQVLKVAAKRHGKPESPFIYLGPGEAKEDVSIVLSRGSRIIGSVHPARRTGNEVRVLLRKPYSLADGSTKVDADGNFEFSGLEAGTHFVRLWSGDRGDWVEEFDQETEVEVPVESDVEVAVGDPDTYSTIVYGRVTRGGKPAAGMLMYVYRPEEDTHMPRHVGRTDDEGRYEAPLRQLGEHSFCVGEGQTRQARFTVDVTGEKRQEQDFELPQLELRGRARLWTGAPASGVQYMLTHSDVASDAVMMGHTAFASSLKNGTFVFTGLHPGTYRLRSGNYRKASISSGLVILEGIVVGGEEEPAEISLLIPEGSIVNVTAEDNSGLPLAGRKVELRNVQGRLSVLWDPRTTDSRGRLRFTGVGPGAWTAVVKGATGQVIGRSRLDVEEGGVAAVRVTCER